MTEELCSLPITQPSLWKRNSTRQTSEAVKKKMGQNEAKALVSLASGSGKATVVLWFERLDKKKHVQSSCLQALER